MGPEATFYHWFASHAPKNWHVQRIETTTGRGIPDTQVCAAGKEFWLEFKSGGRISSP